MATVIHSEINLGNYPLTSQIGNIRATTSGQSETVALARYGMADQPLFTTVLYAHAGSVTLHGVGPMIEDDMRSLGQSVGDYTLSIGSESVRIRPVYCSHVADGAVVCDKFLTTMVSQRVFRGARFSLTAVPNDDKATFMCLVRLSDGSTDTLSFDLDDAPFRSGVLEEDFEWVETLVKDVDDAFTRMLAVTVFNAGRSRTYYLLDETPDVTFRFRNCFNAVEYLGLRGIVAEKTEVSAGLAVCDGVASQYDRRVERTFRLTSAPLTEQEARSVAQLVASHEVWAAEAGDGSFKRVLITDHDCSVDNDDGELWTVSVTWRHTQDRPHLSAAQLADMGRQGNIFTPQFTSQFL